MATKKLTKKELTAQRIALQERNVERQSIIDAQAAAITAAANQPYLEELPPKFEADIPAYLKAVETGRLAPGILKEGFTEGLVPEDIYKKLNMTSSPDVVGWRVITNPDGTQQLEVQTGIGASQTYGADISGKKINSKQSQIANLTNQQTAAANIAAANAAAAAESQRRSIIAILTDRFNKYGLGSLVAKIRELAIDGATEATITLALQETPEYQQRFAANAERLKKNLQVLSPVEYINLEDSYRQVLRAYGLIQFDTDDYVRQFVANDMSAAELSDRIS